MRARRLTLLLTAACTALAVGYAALAAALPALIARVPQLDDHAAVPGVRGGAVALALLAGATATGVFLQRRLITSTLRRAWRHRQALVAPVPRADALALAAVTAALAALVALHLGQPMRTDEAGTVLAYGHANPLRIAGWYDTPNNHIAHSLMLRLSVALFGDSRYAVRLPATLLLLTWPALTYAVGRAWADRRTALLAAGLTAGLGGVIDVGTNARGYALMIACLLAVIALLPRLTRRPLAAVSAPAWVAVTLLAALGCYAVPVMAVPLLAVPPLMLALRVLPEWRRGSTPPAPFRTLLRPALPAALLAALAVATLLGPPAALAMLGGASDAAAVVADNAPNGASRLSERASNQALIAMHRWLRGVAGPGTGAWLPTAVPGILLSLAAVALLLARAPLGLLLGGLTSATAAVTLATGVILPPWSHIHLLPPSILAVAWLATRPLRRPPSARSAWLAPIGAAVTATLLLTSAYPRVAPDGASDYHGYPEAAAVADHLHAHLPADTDLAVPQVLWPPLLLELRARDPQRWLHHTPAAPLPLHHRVTRETWVLPGRSPSLPPLAELLDPTTHTPPRTLLQLNNTPIILTVHPRTPPTP